MRILITGALGFIGSFLAETYLQQGHDVFGIDDLSGNVVDGIDGVDVWHADARHIRDLRRTYDLVVHAASPVGAVALLEQESIVAEIVETTQAAISYCRRHDASLVNISSSEVYGFSGVYRETDPCKVPHRLSHRLQYAAGKLAAEQLVRTSGLPSVTVRPFNVAGPRQSRAKGFVLPTFCEQALSGEALTVFDDGTQQRCPTGVWDVCDFIANYARPTVEGRVFNVGNAANRTTVTDLAYKVRRVAESWSPIEYTTGKQVHGPGYEEAEGHVKVPDASRAEATGWEARVGLEELVRRTVAETRERQLVKGA